MQFDFKRKEKRKYNIINALFMYETCDLETSYCETKGMKKESLRKYQNSDPFNLLRFKKLPIIGIHFNTTYIFAHINILPLSINNKKNVFVF